MSRIKKNSKLKAIDFFCGGGGMSYGIQSTGIKVIGGIDYDINCKDTYEENIKSGKFLHADISQLEETDIAKTFSIKRNDDDLIFIGCSPCQYWSIINTKKEKAKKSKNLLTEFHRFVKYYKPGYIIVENVPGILNRKEESGLDSFIHWLKNNGYVIHYSVHNISEYSVPQNRKRFTLIANRVSKEKITPIKGKNKIVVRDVIGENNGFSKIPAGHKDLTDFRHTVPNITELTLKRIKKVRKNGGNRFDFADDPTLQLNCFKGKDNSFKDTFGRLWWDKPAPTITTKFYSVSNGRFVHPDENRALSLREAATLQSFPKNFKFMTNSLVQTARIIGNAVPPEYARRIALSILKMHK